MATIDKNISIASNRSYFALLKVIQDSSPYFNLEQYYYLAKIGLMLEQEHAVGIAEKVVSTCGRGKILREVYPALIGYNYDLAKSIYEKYK